MLQVKEGRNINSLHVKMWCTDRLSSTDHRASAEKQAEDPPDFMVPPVINLSLILHNLWTETEIKRLNVSLVCF